MPSKRTMLPTITPLLLFLTPSISALCTRPLLQSAITSYLSAQRTGTPSLLPLAPNASYTENDATVAIAKGILSQAVTIDLHRSLLDTVACATFTEITAATNAHPYVIDTRLQVSEAGLVTGVESVVADTGDWVFNATSHLRWSKEENWDPIPEGKRDSRAVIQAAGDAYLDSWADGKVSVPYGTPCARLEGGAYTGERNASTNSCRMPEFPKPFAGANRRRYVVDEEGGGVGILNDFPFIDKTKPDGTASVNFVRVQGGKIRYIHETTVCATKNCGR